MITKYDVYEAEGELLDAAYLAAINERTFYLQKELNDLTEQVLLLDHITPEAQRHYFFESVRKTSDSVNVCANPALNAGVRKVNFTCDDGCGNDRDLYEFATGR